MSTSVRTGCFVIVFGAVIMVPELLAQPAGDETKEPEKKLFGKKDFPFGGPGGFKGGPFGQPQKLVKQFDRDGDGRLNADERRAAREFLKKQGGPGGLWKKDPGKFGPKGGGPGAMVTRPLMEALDTDQDGRVTKDELLRGVKLFFGGADNAKRGTLDEEQLAAELNRILPRPKDFPGGGPPGGGPPTGFGPGNFFAGSILRRVDADKTGKATLAQMLPAAEKLFREADRNADAALDAQELSAAVALVLPRPGGPGFGPRGGLEPGKPGPRVAPADVKTYPTAGLYEPTVLRTLFLEFENRDWEAELADFRNTDVEVPATLTVDGNQYQNVGVHFRGMSSYFAVPAGSKRSLNLSLDFADKKQRLHGVKTLNLLNSHDDPTYLHTVLYSRIARSYIPAPRANFVKVVINGESWGVYVNAEQFNKEFVAENFKTTRGARWKVRGSPGGGGGLDYLGENVEDYKRRYSIKSEDRKKDWEALIALCRTLDRTPPEKLEAALRPMLDIDATLWFLALDVALINNDGYWIRASDYSIYRDPKGKFHIVPHDMNETFSPGMGPGFFRGFGPGAKGGKDRPSPVAVDPLVGLDDPRKPLRSKLLAVPALKARYLEYVRTIATDWLDWKKLGPVVAAHRALIEDEIKADTRKLTSLAAFQHATADAPAADRPGRGMEMTLRAFADQRRAYLLNHPAIKTAGAGTANQEARP
jgi:hypothetical protein